MSWSGLQLCNKLFLIQLTKNGECVTQTVHKLQTIFGRIKGPCKSTVCRLMTKFETTGSVLMVKSPGSKCFCRTKQEFVLVQDHVTASAGKSIC